MRVWLLKSDEEFEDLQLVHFEVDYNKYFKKIANESLADKWGNVEVYTLTEGKKVIFLIFWELLIFMCSLKRHTMWFTTYSRNIFRMNTRMETLKFTMSPVMG